MTGIILLGSMAKAQDATALYNEGLKLKQEKKVPEAIDKFKKALALKPDYTEAQYEMGWCLNDLKEYESAISFLRRARIGWPAVPKVHFELGWAFRKTNRTDSAIQSFNKCLQYKPDYSGAWRELGYILYDRAEHENALLCFNNYERNVKDSIRDYLYFYRKGFCYNAVKKFDSAAAVLNQSVRLNTKYMNTWLEMGFTASRLKKEEDAIGYYKKAAELDPRSHIPYNGIGEVYRDLKKDREEAMKWYRKALEVKPRERKACFGIGYCLNSQEKYNEAIPYLRIAIEEETTYTAAFVELGYSLYKIRSYTEAEEKLLKAISLNAKNENARYYLTLLYIEQRNKSKAQQMVNELKEISSKYVTELQNKVNGM